MSGERPHNQTIDGEMQMESEKLQEMITGMLKHPDYDTEEKVKRLNKYISDYSIDEFYSDSFSDTPLAKLSKRAFIVKGNELFDWNEYKK